MKRIISSLITVAIILSVFSVIFVSAETNPNEIVKGDYIYLPLSQKTATIVEYTGKDSIVDIPSEIDGYKIVGIDDGAFICCMTITEVTVPNSVTSIGNDVFRACHSLTSITLPDALTSIGMRAFRAALSLNSIVIPDSVQTIGRAAFANCPKLKDVKIGTGIKTIGDHAFNASDTLTISGYVNTVAYEFAYNNGIKFISLGDAPVIDPTTPTVKPVEKKANPVKVTAKTTSVKAKNLKSKKQTVKALIISKAQGKVTVALVKSGTTKAIRNKVTVSNKGVVTLKKGNYNKATYNVKVKITAKGNSKYKSKTVTKTVKIKIK